jgi:hypothetical protein
MVPPPRLYAVLARDAPVGVVFRRGPSKRVLLIAWNLETDAFIPGQWLKGRIHEERCDLSPDGDLLVYFAADQAREYGTWTAISRPPYLTALALWPLGDTWSGGGLFESATSVAIDHPDGATMADGFTLPPWLHVRTLGDDERLWNTRMQRDGWRLTSPPGKVEERRWVPPQVWEKPQPGGRRVLRMTLTEMTRTRAWHIADYDLVDGTAIDPLGTLDWADWDRNGELLFAKDGALHRGAHVLADFSGLTFEPREPSEEAKRWPARSSVDGV